MTANLSLRYMEIDDLLLSLEVNMTTWLFKSAFVRLLLIPAAWIGLGVAASEGATSENVVDLGKSAQEQTPHRLAVLQSLLGKELVPGNFSGHEISEPAIKQHFVQGDPPNSPPVGPPP
jgi:hypothetical protein